MARATLPPVNYDLIKFSGGLDQITPTLSLPPGVARRAANFECSLNGGYTRIAGYERFDGRPNPSDAQYNILHGTFSCAVGNTVTGVTSTNTAVVIAVEADFIVVTKQSGDFTDGETLNVGASPVGTLASSDGIASDGATDAEYRALAAGSYRADIGKVPGSGQIRGVVYFDGKVYAWRDADPATEMCIYVSSTSGWTKVDLGYEMKFDTGSVAIAEGATVTGGTSSKTAKVRRVVWETGDWSTTDAAGRLILDTPSGAFTAAEDLKIGGVTHAKCVANATAITLIAGGRVEACIANFGGGTSNRRIYGCDGKNRGFEFDGKVYAPIATKMPTDVPTRAIVHKQHLFFAFGSSLQFSAIADPYQWAPVLGAGEIAMNDDISVLITLPGNQAAGALAVYTESDTSVLYGNSSADFKLAPFNMGTGARAYTGQNLDQTYVLSDRGVMGLGTTLNFGNFATAALTMNLRPFIQERRTLASASILSREKGQYRVFFSDGYGLYLTIANGTYVGAMPVQFFDPVLVCCEGETGDGSETAFFGSTSGYVFRLDAGTSFDGEDIAANLVMVYDSMKSPRVLKRFRKASIELTGDSWAEFTMGYDLGYRSVLIDQSADADYSNDLRVGFWDSMTWDNFVFDGSDVLPSEVELTGTAENVSFRISSVSARTKPFTVNSLIVHFTPRRGMR